MNPSEPLPLAERKEAVWQSLRFFKREKLKAAIKVGQLRKAKKLLELDLAVYEKQMTDLDQRVRQDLLKHMTLLKTKE